MTEQTTTTTTETGAAGTEATTTTAGAETAGGEEKKFSQAELDAIVGDRLKRQKAQLQPGDLEDLRSKAKRLDEIEAASKTEAEKAAERLAAAEKKAADTASALRVKTVENALLFAAAGKLADPSDAVRYLGDQVEIDDDGQYDTAKVDTLVAGLVESRPYLAAQGDGRPRGDAGQGARSQPDNRELADAALKEGRVNESIGLKTAGLFQNNK